MTREEAIDRLMWLKDVPHINDDKWIEAVDMAIEALSEPSGDLISRADAIEAVWKLDKEATEYVVDDTHEIHGYCTAIGVCVGELSALPSAEAEPMTEKVREALMRLTMCAREECDMCKYKDECGYDFQYKISTDNMNTLTDALMRSKCEVDAKSADAVQGYAEWLEKIIVMLEPEYLCEDTTDEEWCEENCKYDSIQAECLRHLYKGGDDE